MVAPRLVVALEDSFDRYDGISVLCSDRTPRPVTVGGHAAEVPSCWKVDSAAAGAAAIAAKGSRKFVLLVAEGTDSAAVGKRVANSLSIHGATLVVTLEPCPMCAGAIMHARQWSIEHPDATVLRL